MSVLNSRRARIFGRSASPLARRTSSLRASRLETSRRADDRASVSPAKASVSPAVVMTTTTRSLLSAASSSAMRKDRVCFARVLSATLRANLE